MPLAIGSIPKAIRRAVGDLEPRRRLPHPEAVMMRAGTVLHLECAQAARVTSRGAVVLRHVKRAP